MDTVIPRKRGKDLVARPHGDETLVLDRRTGTAHCLPAEIARVWDACTGRTTLAEIASVARVDQRIAASAVDQLLLLDLLEGGTGFDRRKFLRRSAAVGAGVAAVPVIESVIAPSPAWAASPTRTITVEPGCTGNTDNGRLKDIYVTLTNWPGGTYQVQTTIGPVPAGCTLPNLVGTTYTSALTNVSVSSSTMNSSTHDIIYSGTKPLGSTPNCTTTPVTVNVYQNNILQKSVTVGASCPCSTTNCPPGSGASASPADTASPSPTDTASSVPSPAGRTQLRVHPLLRHTSPPPRTAPVQPSGSPTVPDSSPSARATGRRR